MTDRLYYTDSNLLAFEGRVLSCESVDGRAHLVLDRSAFYPTSGGQPFDTGRLGAADVLDVFERDDEEVVHVTSEAIAIGALVRGEIDAERRRDHRQQHTGQHILSAAFERVHRVATVSFHLGTESSTIDLAREVTPQEIEAAEREANRVVWENGPVTVRFVSSEEAAMLPLRKPPARAGSLRLVEIADVDLSACGGTHVNRTGEVGIVAVSGWERLKGGTRLTFVCGERTRRSHGALRDAVTAVSRVVSVPLQEVAAGVERLRDEAQTVQRTRRRLEEALSEFRAAELAGTPETIGRYSVVLREEPELDAAGLKTLASAVARQGSLVVVLVGAGRPAPTVVARSGDVDVDTAVLLRSLVDELGGRGGGRPDLAQGGLLAEATRILDRVRQQLS